MTQRLGLNLALLLVIAVLAAVIYFEPGLKPSEAPDVLLPLAAEQIEKIQLQHDGAQAITIERVDNGWEIVEPIRVAASDFRVQSLLKLMTATSHGHFPASKRPLSSFGLDQPAGKVSFNGQAILFGDDEPVNRRRYVLVGDQVHLINNYHFYQSQLLLTALVDMALLPATRTLTEIQLPGLWLQQSQGDWQLKKERADEPFVQTSMDAINGLVSAWRHVRALQISRYQSDVADVAEAEIKLSFADGDEMVLEILARQPELILGRRELGLRYHFSAEQGERLLGLQRSLLETESMPEVMPEAVLEPTVPSAVSAQ